MDDARTVRIGKRGELALPADLRRRFGLKADALAVLEVREEGVLLRPAATASSAEAYSQERKAAFLLSNATDESDYQAARSAVEEMGLNPDGVGHLRPDEAPPGA